MFASCFLPSIERIRRGQIGQARPIQQKIQWRSQWQAMFSKPVRSFLTSVLSRRGHAPIQSVGVALSASSSVGIAPESTRLISTLMAPSGGFGGSSSTMSLVSGHGRWMSASSTPKKAGRAPKVSRGLGIGAFCVVLWRHMNTPRACQCRFHMALFTVYLFSPVAGQGSEGGRPLRPIRWGLRQVEGRLDGL